MDVLTIILVILSVVAILISFIILILLITKVLEPKSKRVGKKNLDGEIPVKPPAKSQPKDEISKLWIIPFIVFIVILVALIFAVFMMETDMEEEKMHKIISDTNIILKGSRERIDTVSLSGLANEKQLLSYQTDVIPQFSTYTTFEELRIKDGSHGKLVRKTLQDIREFETWIGTVISQYPSKCGAKTDVNNDQLHKQIHKVNDIQSNIGNAIWKDGNTFKKMENDVIATLTSQQNLDIGESKIVNHTNTMKAMIDHFGTDISNTEITRQKWSNKMSSTLPTISTHFIITILVPFSCAAMILLCIVVIIVIIRPIVCASPKLSSIGTLSPVFITGLVIIITSIIVSVACLGLVGTWSCSLKDGYFGLSNFTSPFKKNITVSICETVGTNFFAGLGSDKLITSESVVQNLKVDEYKRKMLEIFTSSNISIVVPAEFSKKLNAIDEILKKLNDLFGRNCLKTEVQQKLADYLQLLKTFLDENKSYIKSIETFNENVARTESIVTPWIDEMYIKIVKYFDAPINKIQQQITASDFSCNPIIASYSKTAESICKKFEVPLEAYWILLMFTIVVFVIILIVEIFVYRRLKSLIKVDATPADDKKTKKSSTQKPPKPEAPNSEEKVEPKVEDQVDQDQNTGLKKEDKNPTPNSVLTFADINSKPVEQNENENQDDDGKKKCSTPNTPTAVDATQGETASVENSKKEKKRAKRQSPATHVETKTSNEKKVEDKESARLDNPENEDSPVNLTPKKARKVLERGGAVGSENGNIVERKQFVKLKLVEKKSKSKNTKRMENEGEGKEKGKGKGEEKGKEKEKKTKTKSSATSGASGSKNRSSSSRPSVPFVLQQRGLTPVEIRNELKKTHDKMVSDEEEILNQYKKTPRVSLSGLHDMDISVPGKDEEEEKEDSSNFKVRFDPETNVVVEYDEPDKSVPQ